ncbi:Uncharacterized protein FKW44_010462, partial [Caligus rogercresseyi]
VEVARVVVGGVGQPNVWGSCVVQVLGQSLLGFVRGVAGRRVLLEHVRPPAATFFIQGATISLMSATYPSESSLRPLGKKVRRHDVTVGVMMPNTITAAGNLGLGDNGHLVGVPNTTPVILAVMFLDLGEVLLVREEPERIVVDR